MSEKMIFCLGDGQGESKGEGYQKNLRIFNQDVSEDEYSQTVQLLKDNKIKIQLTKWIEYKDLDKSEQTAVAKQLNGSLKVFSYEEAWSNFWQSATKKQRDTITDLKWFDAEIFKEITGIDVSGNTKKQELLNKADELISKANELKQQAEEI